MDPAQRAWLPTCASQLGWSEDDRRRLGHWAPGSHMMDTYDRALCTTELRQRNSIFGKIANDGWTPTKSSDVPRVADVIRTTPPRGSAQEQTVLRIKNEPAIETTSSGKACEPSQIIEESEDDSSASSITWGNCSILSEADIADLYGG